jgi:pyruvate/2-oxoglutarate dehydrogenase complex dihydrolipoamide acyltransferase (E2) component
VSPEFRKVALIAASLGLLVSLFFALRPDDDEQAAATTAVATTAPATTAPAETEPPATTTQPETTEPPATTAPDPNEPVTIRIAVPADTAPKIRRFSVRLNRRVEIVVRSEVTDHVHLHGYDLLADVAPGKPGRITFTADAPGRFELELEDRGLPLAELEVRP